MVKYKTGMLISAPRIIQGIFSNADGFVVGIRFLYHRVASKITGNCAYRADNTTAQHRPMKSISISSHWVSWFKIWLINPACLP